MVPIIETYLASRKCLQPAWNPDVWHKTRMAHPGFRKQKSSSLNLPHSSNKPIFPLPIIQCFTLNYFHWTVFYSVDIGNKKSCSALPIAKYKPLPWRITFSVQHDQERQTLQSSLKSSNISLVRQLYIN